MYTTLLLNELALRVSLNLFLNSFFEWPLVIVLLAIVKNFFAVGWPFDVVFGKKLYYYIKQFH